MPSLATLREAKGWSPVELARHAGVDVQIVDRIEHGQVGHISRRNITQLAEALGVHPTTVSEFQPSLGLTTVGETGAGEEAKTGAPRSDS
jgi:transcriptional regulator with XRE-family HTH domain